MNLEKIPNQGISQTNILLGRIKAGIVTQCYLHLPFIFSGERSAIDLVKIVADINEFVCPKDDIQAVILFGSTVKTKIVTKTEKSRLGKFKKEYVGLFPENNVRPKDIDLFVLMKNSGDSIRSTRINSSQRINYKGDVSVIAPDGYGSWVNRGIKIPHQKIDIFAMNESEFSEALEKEKDGSETVATSILKDGVIILGDSNFYYPTGAFFADWDYGFDMRLRHRSFNRTLQEFHLVSNKLNSDKE